MELVCVCAGGEWIVRSLEKDWGLEVLTFKGKIICFII